LKKYEIKDTTPDIPEAPDSLSEEEVQWVLNVVDAFLKRRRKKFVPVLRRVEQSEARLLRMEEALNLNMDKDIDF
tara:strand:- start:296 stop:520 length:225 start_codon:yes stop_codon:yes gene_type:complete